MGPTIRELRSTGPVQDLDTQEPGIRAPRWAHFSQEECLVALPSRSGSSCARGRTLAFDSLAWWFMQHTTKERVPRLGCLLCPGSGPGAASGSNARRSHPAPCLSAGGCRSRFQRHRGCPCSRCRGVASPFACLRPGCLSVTLIETPCAGGALVVIPCHGSRLSAEAADKLHPN